MSPTFLTVEDVLEIHEAQIRRFGGAAGIRDLKGLESALAQPAAGFGGQMLHKDLHEMAAAYAFHIAMNHPFLDGNKRVGLVAASVFLELNDVDLAESDVLYDAMIAVVEKRMDKRGLADTLRSLSTPRSKESPPPS